MTRPTVILVGADKGGVGKTTISRALLDFFGANNIPTRAFDTETPKGSLRRFHPDITEVIDISSTADQMKVFDTINSSSAHITLIDIRAGLLSTTLRALRDVGFLEAAKKNELTFIVFHILGPSVASLDEIADIAPFTADANYFLVKNFINNTTFFDWDPATYNSYFKKIKGAHEITIPKLNELACEQVELASVPYVSFVANKGPDSQAASYSFVLRGYVKHWLGKVWAEFDRVKLLDIVVAEPQRKTARQA
ncbi:MAG TPA: hypothetical protein VF208_12310 [Candidatus Binatia bacterium]